jgi:phosphatidylglycerophosphate synthase
MSIEHIPGYLAGADSDPLMIVMAIVLVIIVLVAGVLYFKLHAVPEHIAHGKNHTQMQLIAILTILALFTHNNIFWVAALVLAVVEFPDFLSPLKSIAKSLETIAKAKENGVHKASEKQVVDQHVNKENN